MINKAGFPVKNASYWRKRYLDLAKETNVLCDIITGEWTNSCEEYIRATKVQMTLELPNYETGIRGS